MSVMVLRWRVADPPIKFRWAGPDGRVRAVAQSRPETIAAVVGTSGADGAPTFEHEFSFGDATPDALVMLNPGQTVHSCRVAIDTAFNGAGAQLSIGTLASPNLIMPADDVLCSEAGIYERAPAFAVGAPTEIAIFITPGAGASTGAGRVFIEYS